MSSRRNPDVPSQEIERPRARDLGIPFEGLQGPHNAITDVSPVEVGHVTIIEGEGDLVVGKGPIRTGVTVLHPQGADRHYEPVFAGWYSLNGFGELTGTTWIEEGGFLEGPIALTNTLSIGTVRNAILRWKTENERVDTRPLARSWRTPVVGETNDGKLNDILGFHVTEAHVRAAIDAASSGPVPEGSVGGGTGMVCHFFKGGIGTASRVIDTADGKFTVGVLVQANQGQRHTLRIAGVPMGDAFPDLMPQVQPNKLHADGGSIIVVVATDAPLLPHQLKRLARRVPLGIARVGGMGDDDSGDIFIAFTTANANIGKRSGIQTLRMLPNRQMTPLFEGTTQATEEAIVNALVAADDMTGIQGNRVCALPTNRVREILRKHRRLAQ